jgi:hemerythrin-like domain-containing protein
VRARRLRQRILSDHDHLRGLLAEVEQQAFRVARGGGEGVDELRALGLQLLSRFRDHLALEDRLLAPALRRAGSAGRERADRLDADHREQRELLDYLLDKLRDPSRPAAVLAADWASFVELLLDDMAQEERMILEKERVEALAPAQSPSAGSPASRVDQDF